MPRPRIILAPAWPPPSTSAAFVRARTRTYAVPPVEDALVIGADAPIKARMIGEAFNLLETGEFSMLGGAGGLAASILVRTALLRRIGPGRLLRVLRPRLRDLMTSREVLSLRIELETSTV